jgi:hypothetical protein
LKVFFHKPFHPLLWAIFPSLALLGNNISHIPPINTLRAFLSSIALAAIMLGVFRLVFKSWGKAALADTAFLVLFFNYGHVYNLIQNHVLLGFNYGRHRILFPLFIILLIAILYGISRLKELSELTVALNFLGLLLLIFPIYQIIAYQVNIATVESAISQASLQAKVDQLNLSPGVDPPDIYYIIPDTYTRLDALDEYFSYDNSGFIQALENRGFFVAGCSQSNYSFTDLSLTTSLNITYPEDLSNHLTSGNKNISDAYPYLTNNLVTFTLQKLGYSFVSFESGYQPTEFTHADVYYSPLGDWQSVLVEDSVTSFESMQLNTTEGMLFFEFNSYLPAQVQKILDASVIHRQRMLYQLDQLDQMASLTGPKFVFVHLLAPHNPFVFGPDGETITRKTPFNLNDDRDVITMQDYVAGYRDQVTYLNQRLLAIADDLIQQSSQPPIIIIQGDHGVPRLTEWDTAILNAYYLPGDGNAQLYGTISPVNSFRVVFNQYFGGQLPLLEDRSCNLDKQQGPYSCIPVTDPNPQCTLTRAGENP